MLTERFCCSASARESAYIANSSRSLQFSARVSSKNFVVSLEPEPLSNNFPSRTIWASLSDSCCSNRAILVSSPPLMVLAFLGELLKGGSLRMSPVWRASSCSLVASSSSSAYWRRSSGCSRPEPVPEWRRMFFSVSCSFSPAMVLWSSSRSYPDVIVPVPSGCIESSLF